MFRAHLKQMVESTDGGVAGMLMGFDGIAVDTFTLGDDAPDINTIGMEFSFLLTQIKKAAESLELGAVHEVTVRAEKLTLLMRIISAEYFVALAVTNGGNFGKGRYLLRVVAPKLQAEIA